MTVTVDGSDTVRAIAQAFFLLEWLRARIMLWFLMQLPAKGLSHEDVEPYLVLDSRRIFGEGPHGWYEWALVIMVLAAFSLCTMAVLTGAYIFVSVAFDLADKLIIKYL